MDILQDTINKIFHKNILSPYATHIMKEVLSPPLFEDGKAKNINSYIESIAVSKDIPDDEKIFCRYFLPLSYKMMMNHYAYTQSQNLFKDLHNLNISLDVPEGFQALRSFLHLLGNPFLESSLEKTFFSFLSHTKYIRDENYLPSLEKRYLNILQNIYAHPESIKQIVESSSIRLDEEMSITNFLLSYGIASEMTPERFTTMMACDCGNIFALLTSSLSAMPLFTERNIPSYENATDFHAPAQHETLFHACMEAYEKPWKLPRIQTASPDFEKKLYNIFRLYAASEKLFTIMSPELEKNLHALERLPTELLDRIGYTFSLEGKDFYSQIVNQLDALRHLPHFLDSLLYVWENQSLEELQNFVHSLPAQFTDGILVESLATHLDVHEGESFGERRLLTALVRSLGQSMYSFCEDHQLDFSHLECHAPHYDNSPSLSF